MSKLKQLAGETIWYGGSSIAARFLNYLLTPFLTDVLSKVGYGIMSLVYAAIPVFNVLFTYGMETAFFRFTSNKEHTKDEVYNTTGTSIIITTILAGGILLYFYKPLAALAGVAEYPELILVSIIIIMLDTLAVIPFARLRLEGRPKKYAGIKVAGILVNIFFTLFYLWFCKKMVASNANSFWSLFYDADKTLVYYVVVANLWQAAITYILLYKEVFALRFTIDKVLWKKIMVYSMPLVIAGLGGVINETFDRRLLKWRLPGSADFKNAQIGIYSACYKLSILITLFIQAFRMGAEPFFFKAAAGENPQKIYARVLKFFVIVISAMFLFVVIYLPLWKYFIDEKFWEGLPIVPILLLANMFLGIYLNLSIWYKLGNKTHVGAYITIIGSAITLAINYFFIPVYGFYASAWATFFCYGGMMAISYAWGQKSYPIPYNVKKIAAYFAVILALYGFNFLITSWIESIILQMIIGTFLLLLFVLFITKTEKHELSKLPFVGKYFSNTKPA